MTSWAADFAWFQIGAAGLLKAGFSAAVRYCVPGNDKSITPPEFANLTTTPGISLALVNETFAQAASRGYGQGRQEAIDTFTYADQLGWPKDKPIYMVCEDPNSLPPPWPLIEDYLRGVLTVVPPSRVGDYGSGAQVSHALELGLVSYGWTVETWPGDQSRSHLQQRWNPYPGAPTNFGGNVDVNLVLKPDFGQWSAVTPTPVTPIPTPEDPMAVVEIGNQEQLFHVDGDGNLVHRWYVPGGGWHGEVRQTECVPHIPVDIDPHYTGDGFFHVYAPMTDGRVAHSWWDGQHWHDEQLARP